MSLQEVRVTEWAIADPLEVELVDAAGTALTVDETVTALSTIPTQHHEVHEGETFNASAFIVDLADDANLVMLLVTAAGVESHLTFELACGGDAEVQFYEDTTTSNQGVGIAERNMKRSSANVATTVVTKAPTVTLDGTLLFNKAIPGGTGGNAAGGSVRDDTEWILAPNKQYLIRLFNRSGNPKIASIVSQWYEESV
jgi:hypothetical protein